MKYKNFLTVLLLALYHQASVAKEVSGVTSSTILLGQSAAFSGPSALLGRELRRGAKAYFDFINHKGGINGRMINVISLDDQYIGENTIRNTIKLIKEKKVFALFGYVGTPTLVSALPVIRKFSNEGLILFSNFTGAEHQRNLPYSDFVFNVRSSYKQETKGLVENLIKIGYKKIGVFAQADTYGASGTRGVKSALDKHNLKITKTVTYRHGSKYSDSMMRQVDILKKSGAKVVISIGSYEACAAFIRDARKSGFQGPIANISFVGAEALLDLLVETEKKESITISNNLINSQVVPLWNNYLIPIVREYKDIMNKFSNTKENDLKGEKASIKRYSFVSLEGFLNAKILVRALSSVKEKLTRTSFKNAIESLNNVDVGLHDRVNFSKSKHQALDSVFYTTVRDGKYVSIKDWKGFSQ